MNQTTLLALLGLPGALALATSACSSPHAASSTPAPEQDVHAKPGAAVTVDAALAASSARVHLRFDADAQDVTVHVGGVDGLVVTRGGVLDVGDVARGDVRTLDVAFTPGDERSHLVVAVSGTYATGALSRVSSFAVGETREKSTQLIRGDGRERVHLIPVGGR
ncbi:MAG: hypothetical protein KC668_18745 [Myxococcales bacterium]|nr:hypothetical protein [Myxococcales bacterium]